MKENNLIASVALFSGLYNNEKYENISDIIALFIEGAVCSEKRWSVNSTELTKMLYEVYEFLIPESVVKTTLKYRMKRLYNLKDGWYNFKSELLKNDYELLNEEYIKVNNCQNKIVDKLHEYIETSMSIILNEDEKKKVNEDFSKYLFYNDISEVYTQEISAFVIKNKDNEEFRSSLNLIREGLILYQGICYSSDINDQGNWNSELKIFLNTEHLFNAVGYNGLVYKQIFNDFHILATRINQKSRNKNGDKLIELRYFEETKKEVDDFFKTAESILRGSKTLDPSKAAMKEIIKGCKTPSDIKLKQSNFYKEIKQLLIQLQETNFSIYNYPDFVVEDDSIINELKRESKSKGKLFDEDEYRRFCSIYTKVNYFRGGQNNKQFEKIGHIFLTANGFALWIGHHTKVKFQENDIPFATDIDYVTSKFWFKLRKGFGERDGFPKSLDVITKAQVILSSQINSAVSKQFYDYQLAYKEGRLTKEQALSLSYDLREKSAMPEQIEPINVDESINFINEENYIEHFFREKEVRDQEFSQLEEKNKVLQHQLDSIHQNEEAVRMLDFENKRLIRKKIIIRDKLDEYKKLARTNKLYFLKVLFCIMLPTLLGVMFNVVEMISADFSYVLHLLPTSIGSVITIIEVFCRSYLFDKEKIKNGYKHLKLHLNTDKKRKMEKDMEKLWSLEFDSEESSQAA